MGVKDLWTVLTPHAERKPISELRGKSVAIDLAGWVCESLNVVDYFVHPRHHLKNLFFRTCYLIWEEVTPVFVLEGVAPKLKSQVIAERNKMQFRGVRPKGKEQQTQSKTLSQQSSQPEKTKNKGRTRFNHVLKQCETLLQAMGIQCVQGPGEAEAYCAFLNKKGLVDGVISQDSDCFAYGAVRVYRNFSVSTQGAQAAQGGAVDIYDMRQICQKMDFGQNKIIVMALLCGCDYCPEGIGGIGRDGVLKLFNKYNDEVILERIRSWRNENSKYTALEMRVDDKSICSNCGHLGRTQSHTKNGCGICRTNSGCDESLWKEERISLKAELMLRKKALTDSTFPSEEVIKEFLTEPSEIPKLNLNWKQPNVVKFIKQIGHLLQWPEIYCFQKFLPVLTRWRVRNAHIFKQNTGLATLVEPKEILKKRTLKGVPSLELIWQDERGFFNGLIPDEQLKEYAQENSTGINELWTTVEPLSMMEEAFPELVETFIKSKEKLKKTKKITKNKQECGSNVGGSLDNLKDLMLITNEIAKSVKPKRTHKNAAATKKGLQLIDKYFKQKIPNSVEQNTPKKSIKNAIECYSSTPLAKCLPSDLESDCDDELFNISDIVNGIIKKSLSNKVPQHDGHILHYESMSKDLSHLINEASIDDLDLMTHKRRLSISALQTSGQNLKRISLDDSFDVLVNKDNHKFKNRIEASFGFVNKPSSRLSTHVDRFKKQNDVPYSTTIAEENNTCYFFNQSVVASDEMDAFQEIMESSFSRKSMEDNKENVVSISDSSDDVE